MASLPPQSSSSGRIRQTSSDERESYHQEQIPYTDSPEQSTNDQRDTSESVFSQSLPESSSFIEVDADDITDAAMKDESQQSQHHEATPSGTADSTFAEASSISPAIPILPTVTDDDEPKKCWICYTDETEDSPLNSQWRSPCPCALYAHESCLLDWLADLENPKSRRYGGRSAKMHCPQCKSEIVIARPRSLVVDLVRKVEQIAGRLVLPGVLFTLAGTVWAGCCAHGVYSLYMVFGMEEAKRMLDHEIHRVAFSSWNPRVNMGLPMIPLTLILSRTRYAESLLPAIPVIFFATHRPGEGPLDFDMWPPSVSMTFAALPYAKSFYGMLYERLFGKLERRWIAEVQPRAGESDESEQGGQEGDQHEHIHHHEHAPDNEGEILMEIGLELDLGMGDDDGPPVAIQAIAQGGGDNQHDGQQADNQQAGDAANQILGRRQNEIIHDTSNLADTVLGALFFPAISAGMGGLLKLTLPRSWTTPSAALEKGRVGFLQTKWGRSVVGGCLFVLLKDALVLYCRWKLAQTHRKRRVLNYDRAKKRVVDP